MSVAALSVATPRIDEREPLSLERLLQYGLAAASAGTALIHFKAAFGHREQALFFYGTQASAAVQLMWATEILRRTWQRRLLAGVALNLVFIGVWALSRTTGLPLTEGVEPLGFQDGINVLLEAGIIAGAALLALIPRADRAVPVRAGRLALGAVTVFVAALTVTAVLFAANPEAADGTRAGARDRGHNVAPTAPAKGATSP